MRETRDDSRSSQQTDAKARIELAPCETLDGGLVVVVEVVRNAQRQLHNAYTNDSAEQTSAWGLALRS